MPVNVFTVTLAGELLGTFSEYELTVNDLYALEGNTGLSVTQMLNGLNEYRAKPVQALVWFMRYKQGHPVDMLSIDFKVTDLVMEAVPTPSKASRRSGSKATVPPETDI